VRVRRDKEHLVAINVKCGKKDESEEAFCFFRT